MNVFRNNLKELILLLLGASLYAQQGGFILGTVHDRSGERVAGAEVSIQNQETGARQKLYCDSGGSYSTSELTPGTYRLTVRSDGFRTSSQSDVIVIEGKTVRVDFIVDLLPLRQEMTVAAAQSDVDPAASGLTVSRGSPTGSLPENGRDVHALFDIMPGATVTPAALSGGGQFTVSGQRPNANSFRVDGVSGNVGMGIPSVPGAILGGTLPGMTAIGGMQSLASKEETERVELRTADFSAEFGDRPGAQISIETRAGSNEFHGSAFGYIRPHALDSQDWFARGAGLDLPSAFLDGWGGSLSGPLWRSHTFLFASFERSGLHDSALEVIPVPSLAARALAGAPYQALFDAFPQPVGRFLNAAESLGYSPLQKDASVTNRSIRLDQVIGSRAQAFARYSDVPSSSSNIELGTAYSKLHWTSITLGLNLVSGQLIQDFRFNYSNVVATSQQGLATNTLNSINNVLAPDLGNQVTQLSIEGVGQTLTGVAARREEDQFTGDYRISKHAGKHDLRAGFDYGTVALQAAYGAQVSSLSIVSPGIEALLAGVPLGLTSSSDAFPQTTIRRYSAFAQDTMRLTDRLSLLLGLRWDVTPPNAPASGPFGAGDFNVGYWKGIGTQPDEVTGFVNLSPGIGRCGMARWRLVSDWLIT